MLRNGHVRFGGPGEPTSRKADRAPRSDPYTYVPTWAGIAYVCFIIDAFSRTIVGWRVASHMRTEMALDAVEMARWSRGTQLAGLRCHSDAGSHPCGREPLRLCVTLTVRSLWSLPSRASARVGSAGADGPQSAEQHHQGGEQGELGEVEGDQ
jgi:transposase InsO family protein